MRDVLSTVEEVRFRARLSQGHVAGALGVTQGHYSKVVSRRVPLSNRLKGRMEEWLATQEARDVGGQASIRIHQLAASIRRQCMELMHLVEAADNLPERGLITPE